MKLESILRYGKSKLGLLTAGTLMALNPLSGCGTDDPTSPSPQQNKAPQTIISSITIEGNRVEIDGTGTDSDGHISKFEYSIDNSTPSTHTGSSFHLVRILSGGNHTFSLTAIDNDNKPDPTPATRSLIIEPEQELEIGTTDTWGSVTFSDGKRINVRDNEHFGIPLENIHVSSFPTEEYRLFSAVDETGEYFPTMNFSSPTTTVDENILMQSTQTSDHDIRFLASSQRLQGYRFLTDLLSGDLSKTTDCSIYKKTVSGEEALGHYNITNGILALFGVDWIMTLAGNIAELAGETDNQSYRDFIIENNWDQYEITTPLWEGSPFDQAYRIHARFPSNQPTITLEEIVTEGQTTTIRFSGFDRLTYQTPADGILYDHTTTCRGPTTGIDFRYFFEVTNPNGSTSVIGSKIAQEVELELLDLPAGSGYNLSIELTDDTYWKNIYNDSGLNQDNLETTFTVGGSSNTVVIQPGPDNGCDTYIRKCGYNYPNDNYGQEIHLKLISEDVYVGGEFVGQDRGIVLVKYDIISQIPNGAEVTGIKLQLYGQYSGANHAFCYSLNNPWHESTATWFNTYSNINNPAYICDTPPAGNETWFTWDISEYAWDVNNIDEHGLALRGLTGEGREVNGIFYSSEHYDTEHRPKLTIEYTQ